MDPASAGHSRDDAPTHSRAWATEGPARGGRDGPRDIGTDDTSPRAICARETRRPALDQGGPFSAATVPGRRLELLRGQLRVEDAGEHVGLHVPLPPRLVPRRG